VAQSATGFPSFISQFVINESAAGDKDLSRERMLLLQGVPQLEVVDEVTRLARALIAQGAVPPEAATDAAHIAVATVHRMDFLMTWNCTHIANAVMISKIEGVCQAHGYACPVICTPEELMEG